MFHCLLFITDSRDWIIDMYVARLFCYLMLTFMLASCSGIRVSQDYLQGYNFSSLKTFAWMPNDAQQYGVRDNDLLAKRITTTIQNKLTGKGYSMAESGAPDFYIRYNVSVEQKISSSNVTGGIGIGRSTYGGFGGIGISSGSQIDTYDEGTLIIYMIDPLNDELIWRGISTQQVSKHTTPEESAAVVDETVEKILAQFPPDKG